jgi:hypothetical protein
MIDKVIQPSTEHNFIPQVKKKVWKYMKAIGINCFYFA